MSGHTPGPWNYDGEDPYGGWVVSAEALGAGDYICWCPDHEQDGDGSANARLIAQSPMLLSSAKHAMKVIERTLSMNEEWLRPADANALRGVLEDLDELITRVEGKS